MPDLLFPEVTDHLSISSPQTAQVVFNTTENKAYLYTGEKWVELGCCRYLPSYSNTIFDI